VADSVGANGLCAIKNNPQKYVLVPGTGCYKAAIYVSDHTPASFHSPAQHTKTKQAHNAHIKNHMHCFFAIFRSRCMAADAEDIS
jgi:hypothetical protein